MYLWLVARTGVPGVSVGVPLGPHCLTGCQIGSGPPNPDHETPATEVNCSVEDSALAKWAHFRPAGGFPTAPP